MKKFLIWCSKYISLPAIAILAFIVYILFIQENSVSQISANNRTIDSLRQAISRERDTMQLYLEKNRRLDNRDPATVERIVREQHNMSLPTEEVYLVKQ